MSESRASGKTAAEEVAREQGELVEQQINPELPGERERRFQAPGFSRMRLDFTDEQRGFMVMMHGAIDKRLLEMFGDAYDLMFELYSVIREPIIDREGQPVLDGRGLTRWKTTDSGQFVEDWSRLTVRQRERFLFQLTTRLVVWEQRVTEAWAESMYAKVTWEQEFAIGYDKPGDGVKDTIEGRTARAKILSKEDHFLAVFKTYYSRKSDALVRSLERLSQRLKDVHVANGGR